MLFESKIGIIKGTKFLIILNWKIIVCFKMSGNIDSWLETVKAGKLLPERDLRILCEKVKEILVEESNLQPVQAPVTVCGDIHG